MPRGKVPDGLEMDNLQLRPGETSPRSPLTPTIKLSRPPSSSIDRKSSLSYTFVNANEEADLVNGGFIDNDKVSSEIQKHQQNGNGTSDASRGANSAPPLNGHSPVESWSLSGSPGSNHTNGDVLNNHKNKNGAYSISRCLMPPKKNSKPKRHSLPLPGFVESSSLKSSDDEADLPKRTTLKNGGSTRSMNLLPRNVPSPTKSNASPWKRWFKRKASNGSEQSSFSDASWMSSAEYDDGEKKPKLWNLARSITKRVSKLRNNEVAPMSQNSLAPPEPAPATATDNNLKPTSVRRRLDSFAPSSVGDVADEIHFKTSRFGLITSCWKRFKALRFPEYFDPLGGWWLCWLSVVTMAFLYNAIVIFLRGAFRDKYQTSNNIGYWVTVDYLCDFVYIIDMLLFRSRLMFFQAGQGITDKRCMLTHYTSSRLFKFDLLSLLPLDLFYFSIGRVESLLRLPRLFKFHSYLEFSQKFENKSKTAHAIRIFRMVCYLLYMIHLNTCLYYAILFWEGIRTDEIAMREDYWVYLDPEVDVYTKCLFRSAKTLIVIGNLPPPNTNSQIFFMNIDFIVGVFVFASMIGQMRDISAKAGATKEQFRRQMDDTMNLLQVWNIPESVQKRVRSYYIYSWDQGAVLDERDLLLGVPIRMQTDIAINVHMDTLSRVSLFQDCDKMLLRDLVLKLRPLVYLPNEYICRKGAVGKEMYIIVDGSVQVLGGENNSKVLATLHPGSVFGEISLLSVGVGNRRTADVAAPGFANLFVLDKKDLQEVVVNYPDAQESLKRKAREILKQNQANDSKSKKRRGKSLIAESILTRDPETTPTFFNAVLQIARNKRITATILKGSFNMKNEDDDDDSRFAFYSSSDISTDEEAPVTIKKRKRPRFTKKKGLIKDALKLGSPGGGGSSSFDDRSDSDYPEPTSVVVHPIPKEQQNITSNPSLPNQIPDALPLSLPHLDHALPSPGLSSSMVTDNDPLEDDQDAHDSGVDVPLDGSAGALTGGSFDYPGEPDGMALDPPGRPNNDNPEAAAIRSEPKIEFSQDEQEKQEDNESTIGAGESDQITASKDRKRSTQSCQESRPTTPTPTKTAPSEKPSGPLRRQSSPAAPTGGAPLQHQQQQPWMQGPRQIPKVLLERQATPAAEVEQAWSPVHRSSEKKDEDFKVKIEQSSSEKEDDKEEEEEMEKGIGEDTGNGKQDEIIDIEEEEKKGGGHQEDGASSHKDKGSSVDPTQDTKASGTHPKKVSKRSSSESSQKAFKPNIQYNPRSIYTTSARTDRPKSKSGSKTGKSKKHSNGDKQKKE
ncbi:cyclic nucleotide-gated cation channel beta-3-like [Lytechinus variegatus]|uniref:cyclic nucleotide-gated cation channel beta-3-like n=1 Tax=Lytechinus variegatus TaxID=7654 RepID=UPI001BB1F128|nr:cyclic nucleotide-gated cation channel beta-3-like [Lytechinus variegatus]